MTKLTKVCGNFYEVQMGDLTVWFSYETPIAFKKTNDITYVRQNQWGRTTGKHINMVKANNTCVEVTGEEFEQML